MSCGGKANVRIEYFWRAEYLAGYLDAKKGDQITSSHPYNTIKGAQGSRDEHKYLWKNLPVEYKIIQRRTEVSEEEVDETQCVDSSDASTAKP